MNNFNFDENTINKLKNMMNSGELNEVISQISPDMMQNFSSMMKNNSTSKKNNSNVDISSDSSTVNNTFSQNSADNTNFNFNNIDMNTILKMKSVMEKLNTNNDPRSNLLHSLKPYLRDSRKEKLDQYANLLNFAQIAELLKKDNNNNNDNKE